MSTAKQLPGHFEPRGSNAMNTSALLKFAAIAVSLAVCSACSGGSATAPAAALVNVRYVGHMAYVNGRPVTAERLNLNAPHGYSSIVPELAQKSDSTYYEYINNYYGSYSSIFNYPKSVKQIGSIDDVGGQSCTNVLSGYGKKTFWIVAGEKQITEYSVPKKPLKTLAISGMMPSSCAMNSDGDLALGVLTGFPNGGGDVVIFKGATGSPTYLATGMLDTYFDGYDPKGNLFADGFRSQNGFSLVELPKGASAFQQITTSNTVAFPGSVQWDGKYLTVADQTANKIYRYTIHGTKATLKGTVSLTGASDCSQTWIAGSVVYCADAGNDDGEVFNYPAGGSPVATFTGNFDEPLGTVAVQK
ncbi:MAG TPA: hypothetical protein VGF98_03895 [Candidatus Tumulicola sp.]